MLKSTRGKSFCLFCQAKMFSSFLRFTNTSQNGFFRRWKRLSLQGLCSFNGSWGEKERKFLDEKHKSRGNFKSGKLLSRWREKRNDRRSCLIFLSTKAAEWCSASGFQGCERAVRRVEVNLLNSWLDLYLVLAAIKSLSETLKVRKQQNWTHLVSFYPFLRL